MSKLTVLRPRLNEKTYALSEQRVYVFDVDPGVSKQSVARAVEVQFDVKVATVNTATVKGKHKRTISLTGKRVKPGTGQRSGFKKAYVTLQDGHSLPFFEAVEEAEQKEQALQEKVDKAAAKAAAPARRGLRRLGKKAESETSEENT